MSLYDLKEAEIRAYAKEHIETLEHWLRQIIDRELRKDFGDNYIEAKKENGDYLFNKCIREEVSNRRIKESKRFPRPVDACLLETEIKIITKQDLYNKYFSKYFSVNFQLGREMLLLFLNRLVYPRNCLYHANPINLRQFEQVICYTHDIIDSIKKYYMDNNLNKEYNVPKALSISDSLGNHIYREQFDPKDSGHCGINLKDPKFYLYPGDELRIEVEVDSTFPRDSYKIKWESAKGIPAFDNANPISFTIKENHIGENLDIRCLIISNKEWHRHERSDDFIIINYKVLPNP